jgi:putative endonuclease
MGEIAMNRDRRFYVYILSNISRTLYVGVTNDIERRIWEHRQKKIDGFTKEYNVTMLVYLEEYGRADDAIAREKQIKNWRREKKVRLIEMENPQWIDLAHEWLGD